MTSSPAAIEIDGLSHRYGARLALDDLSLTIQRGELFVFLGPNGGGKSTLFRALSTLIPVQQGTVRILGHDLVSELTTIRAHIGVVFQAPSVDKKLTVQENIRHQAALYGLSKRQIAPREQALLVELGLADRRHDLVESLSGGLRRRVELAKGMIHQPQLLIMDEPSTGLDPGARSDLGRYLARLRDEFGVTIVMTTHLLEEADKADRLAILHQGRLVALDTPHALTSDLGGETLTVEADDAEALADELRSRFAIQAAVIDGAIRWDQADGHQWVSRLVDAFGERIQSIRIGRPTLEDVFIQRTGHRFWNAAGPVVAPPAASSASGRQATSGAK